jgi:nucleotide-binding universal stress UspA family protein
LEAVLFTNLAAIWSKPRDVEGCAMFSNILVAVDKSKPAMRAVDMAVELARELKAQIALIHVVDSPRAFIPEFGIIDPKIFDELRLEGRNALTAASERIPPGWHHKQFLIEGEPTDGILATAAEWKADLIVIGSDSRGRLSHFLLGSTADAVIRRSPCPVVTVRAEATTKNGPSTTPNRAAVSECA